jgi:Kdo2-lipid IVA lauroyltransferase/acyltransferase
VTHLFRLLSHLPLLVLHGVGAGLGLLVFGLSATYRRRLCANAALAGYGWRVQWAAAMQAGKMAAELPRLWLGKPVRVRWHDFAGFEALRQQAQAQGRGMVVLAPHIGCWEVVGQSIAQATFAASAERMTVMYRPARQAWLDHIIRASREVCGRCCGRLKRGTRLGCCLTRCRLRAWGFGRLCLGEPPTP